MRIITDELLGITENDIKEFNTPCVNDRRCMIQGEHTHLDHLRVGLAEQYYRKQEIK